MAGHFGLELDPALKVKTETNSIQVVFTRILG